MLNGRGAQFINSTDCSAFYDVLVTLLFHFVLDLPFTPNPNHVVSNVLDSDLILVKDGNPKSYTFYQFANLWICCKINHFNDFFMSTDRVMSLSDERVKCFAARCADLGKELGVNVIDLYTLFHEQPVRCLSVTVNSGGSREGARDPLF